MGCSQSLTTDDDHSVIQIKPRQLKFRTHNNVEAILKKQFTDQSGQAFYVIPTERSSFSKVPVLSKADTNQLVLRRIQTKQISSPANVIKKNTSLTCF